MQLKAKVISTYWALFIFAICGCAPRTRLSVEQSHLEGRQSRLELQSDWSSYAHADSDVLRVLLAYPLPGARRGDEHYYVYLRLSCVNRHASGELSPSRVDGVFFQATGPHAGIVRIKQAAVPLLLNSDRIRGRLEAVCEDGTELSGQFSARLDPWRVSQFEDRFAHHWASSEEAH